MNADSLTIALEAVSALFLLCGIGAVFVLWKGCRVLRRLARLNLRDDVPILLKSPRVPAFKTLLTSHGSFANRSACRLRSTGTLELALDARLTLNRLSLDLLETVRNFRIVLDLFNTLLGGQVRIGACCLGGVGRAARQHGEADERSEVFDVHRLRAWRIGT